MSKKVYTFQSPDKKEFDENINLCLELGCELLDGGYQVINNDDGVVYSQVIVFKKNCEVEFYKNGQLKFVQNKNEDGKQYGLSTSWYENGQKQLEGTFKDGEFVGLVTWWYDNGQKKMEGTPKDGKFDGLYTSWYENGQKQTEGNWKNKKEDGLYKGWYENGQKESEVNYKDGEYDGLYTNWYDNGKKEEEGTYKDGKLISHKKWNEDGSVKN